MAEFYPGVLSWSYHRQFASNFTSSAEQVVDKVGALAREFRAQKTGVDLYCRQLPKTDASYLDELKARMAEYRIQPMVSVDHIVMHPDRSVFEPSLQGAIAKLETVARLGAKVAGFSMQWHGRVAREGRIRIATEVIRRLAGAAQPYGITVCTENYDCLRAVDMIQVLIGAGQANAGVLNDTGNWLITGEDPVAATAAVNPYLVHAHVRDYVLEDGVYKSVPVGQGSVDIAGVLALIKKAPTTRPVSLSVEMDLDEGDEDEAVHTSLEYVIKWFKAEGLRV